MEGTASGNTARSRPSSGDLSGLIHFPEKHLHTEQEQNDAAGHFERVHVNADRVENDLADGHGDHEDDSGVNAQRAAPSDVALSGVSEAVSPAKNATFPIGSIVVQSVAKSLLILISSGDIFSVCGNHLRPCNLSSAF